MTRPEASALLAAYEVEDFLCRAFNSRAERLAALKDIILGAIERSMPIPPSDSVALPSAVPAGPPAVDRPRVPPEDMPTPQPAPQPPVQNEAAVIQGEDQLAQKEDGVASTSSAGGSSEHHRKADPRNSSRPAGEGPVLIPAGRTKPSVKSKPYDPRPGRLAGVTITAPGKVVAVDTVNFVVACPGGDWQTSRPVALIMERMRNGEMFGNDILATVGSMSPSVFAESKHRWAEELAKRGVNFIHIKGVGCRIEIAEASA
jgi:hypothetical protein